jgi:hypothetical protein
MPQFAGRHANHTVGRVCGVNAADTKVEAAEKAIAVAKSAGMNTRSMERMLAEYKRREGIA